MRSVAAQETDDMACDGDRNDASEETGSVTGMDGVDMEATLPAYSTKAASERQRNGCQCRNDLYIS